MTAAVCLKCGAMKVGAWTVCGRCMHLPESPEDMAKHLMATDHYLSVADLQGIGYRIENGLPVKFDPEQVAQFAVDVQTSQGEKGRIRWYLFCVFIVLTLLFAGFLIGLRLLVELLVSFFE